MRSNANKTRVGEDGNAFAIVGRVRQAMRRADVPREEIDAFEKEAVSKTYDHVLYTVMRTVNTT